MKDVIIVGAGPAGCFTGKKLAEKGFDVTIIEEDSEIGHPMCCAGIVGAEGLKQIGVDPADWSANELREGVVYSPSYNSIKFSRNKLEAHVIRRSEFDHDLGVAAARNGAELRLNSKCVGVSRDENKISLEVDGENGEERIDGRLVVGADGANSIIARSFDLIDDFSSLAGAQAEVVGDVEGKTANIFFGNEWSEHFFGWVVPAGEVFRVGLCDRGRNVRKNLSGFIRNNPALPAGAEDKVVRFTVDVIPKGGSRTIFGDRVVLVGDAAGHIKPITGGGIFMGLSCADIASEVVEEGLESEPSKDVLGRYGSLVDERFGKEFEIGNRVMRILRNMNDEDLSDFISLLEETEVKNLILDEFEFDRHSSLIKALAKKGPQLLRFMGLGKSAKYLSWFSGAFGE